MIFPRFGLLFLFAALLAAQKVPLATFTGTVRSASNKRITIENQEGNLVDFDITGKTRVMNGKKKIRAEDLKVGDEVSVEAHEEIRLLGQYLVADVITLMPAP
ncbi:MAG TPA: hypothetical protein VMB25_26545 [Bryobacteraceae bacterium]|nr:hypothetical protein [Bryobacteraceae bacterium]